MMRTYSTASPACAISYLEVLCIIPILTQVVVVVVCVRRLGREDGGPHGAPRSSAGGPRRCAVQGRRFSLQQEARATLCITCL